MALSQHGQHTSETTDCVHGNRNSIESANNIRAIPKLCHRWNFTLLSNRHDSNSDIYIFDPYCNILCKVQALTLSSTVMSNVYTSKCSASYQSNLPFEFFDIRALWRSVLSASAQTSKNWKGRLDQYGVEHFGRLIFATIRKSVWLKWLNSFLFAYKDY